MNEQNFQNAVKTANILAAVALVLSIISIIMVFWYNNTLQDEYEVLAERVDNVELRSPITTDPSQ